MGRIDGIFDVFWYAKMPAPQGAGIFAVRLAAHVSNG